MKKMVAGICMMLLASAAFAAEDQAHLGIFAETSVMKIIGMPEMPEMPGLPGGLAGITGMMAGAPQRTLTVRLWSPGIAPAGATAAIEAPDGLKQGKRLDLEIYRPEPEKAAKAEGGEDTDTGETPKFTIKRYWGSSDTVKPGQPQVISFDKLTKAQVEAIQKQQQKTKTSTSYFYKPDWTTGYWPTKKQAGKIARGASLTGKYTLTTSYTGNVSLDVPENVNFLDPISLTSPKLDEEPSLTDPLVFRWKPIPHLLGAHAMVFGMENDNTLVIWSSSEVPSEKMGNEEYLQMAEVEAMVKSTEMMAGDRTEVHVPAGIFQKCRMTSLTMTGYGPGASLAEGQPLPRLQTKTVLNVMLTGMGGGDEKEE